MPTPPPPPSTPSTFLYDLPGYPSSPFDLPKSFGLPIGKKTQLSGLFLWQFPVANPKKVLDLML
jgi:hypothetical protein